MGQRNILVIYSSKNTPGRKDATGAFIPEAERFTQSCEDSLGATVTTCAIACQKFTNKDRRALVKSMIYTTGKGAIERWNGIAFFGHGWPSGCQFGFNNSNVRELANAITITSKQDVAIVFYTCLVAENDVRDKEIKNIGPNTDQSFADRLRDALKTNGITGHVDAHKTAGHTTRNPYVVRFDCEGALVGGRWLIEPQSALWNSWVRKLKVNDSSLRYRYPFLSRMQIEGFLK